MTRLTANMERTLRHLVSLGADRAFVRVGGHLSIHLTNGARRLARAGLVEAHPDDGTWRLTPQGVRTARLLEGDEETHGPD